jgi:pimeloyl-ACP methyl ester carboxylesterase
VRLGATRWPGTGTPIVLLHGLASQRRFWNLVVPFLIGPDTSSRSPVLTLDLRGHGDSDRPDDGYDVDSVAADLAVALDAVGWSRAVVVGHSWGANVAVAFAGAQPARTLSLVCLDGGFTSPLASGLDRATMRERLTPPRLAMPPEELRAMVSAHSAAPRWSDAVAAAVLPIFEVGPDGLARARLPFELHMKIVDEILDLDVAALWDAVRCPAWLVSCEGGQPDDRRSRAKADGLAAVVNRVPAARSFRWEAAVHDVPLQWPALVAGLIRSAVEEVA